MACTVFKHIVGTVVHVKIVTAGFVQCTRVHPSLVSTNWVSTASTACSDHVVNVSEAQHTIYSAHELTSDVGSSYFWVPAKA